MTSSYILKLYARTLVHAKKFAKNVKNTKGFSVEEKTDLPGITVDAEAKCQCLYVTNKATSPNLDFCRIHHEGLLSLCSQASQFR